jgi:hypothetical protein
MMPSDALTAAGWHETKATRKLKRSLKAAQADLDRLTPRKEARKEAATS